MKAIRQAQTRDILDAYNREDISYSRMNEMFNELADEFAIGFADWHLNLSKSDDWEKFDYNTTEKLLEIYKKEKRL